MKNVVDRITCSGMNVLIPTLERRQRSKYPLLMPTFHGLCLSGFSLLELLVTIGILGILVGLLMPAVSKAKNKGHSIACISNLRQLQMGFLSYCDDHANFMPNNHAYNYMRQWRSATNSWTGPSNAAADRDDTAIRMGSLFSYLTASTIYRCPGDRSGTANTFTRRTRSYSLSNICNGQTNDITQVLLKTTSARNPSEGFVFIDEDAESIDDGHFYLLPFPYRQWVNSPAYRHRTSAGLSFLDGHVDTWQWLGGKPSGQDLEGLSLRGLLRLQKALLTGYE